MNIPYKHIALSTMCAFLLVSCGPKKQEEKPAEQKEAVKPLEDKENNDTLLMYPEELSEEEKKALTPQEQEELEINEDNVMNPFPG
jgi:hypothetical protein